MVTVGIDLAAQPSNTAACAVTWGETVVVDVPTTTADDQLLLELIARADRVGIDVPLGWPLPFVKALTSYHHGQPWTSGHGEPVQLRQTDQVVRQLTGKRPLSVSADKIAVPAMRAAQLLGGIDHPVERSGSGKVVEVYPAAALRCWGFPSEGYKRSSGRRIREALVESFAERTRRWVELTPEVRVRCLESDNAFDALVAALVARAAELNMVQPIPEEHSQTARAEGWIALPLRDSLDRLA